MNAEALFIAGGDQSRYVDFWKGTPVEDAINYVAAKPAPMGGTSAGMAIVGEFLYSAMSDESLTSAEASPTLHSDVTLDRDFLSLPKLGGIITDQHLHERDRIGRTVACSRGSCTTAGPTRAGRSRRIARRRCTWTR